MPTKKRRMHENIFENNFDARNLVKLKRNVSINRAVR